jgi:hypothetical protein
MAVILFAIAQINPVTGGTGPVANVMKSPSGYFLRLRSTLLQPQL